MLRAQVTSIGGTTSAPSARWRGADLKARFIGAVKALRPLAELGEQFGRD